jgi:DNA repair/transcription protein MET18/MMS19
MKPRLIATELEAKELTLIDVVQSLGEYINDEDAVMRSRAVDYLSQVIGELSPAFLTRQQIQVLCQFFCDRMRDGGAIPGLCKLQELDKFNSEMAVMTFRA